MRKIDDDDDEESKLKKSCFHSLLIAILKSNFMMMEQIIIILVKTLERILLKIYLLYYNVIYLTTISLLNIGRKTFSS